MNNGKICVSVCAETADELIEQIKRAEELADVIEIRFDCLKDTELNLALQKLSGTKWSKFFLAAFRPKNRFADLTPAKKIYRNNQEKELHRLNSEYRYSGWEKILDLENIGFVDFEYDIHSKLIWNMLFIDFWGSNFKAERERKLAAKLKDKDLISSEHYFLRESIDLEETYERISKEIKAEEDDPPERNFLNPAVIKIAKRTDDVCDTIAVWKLLEKAKSENKKIIPIAMGESGKWTRILGLAHGAFMTYAALDSGRETASGQISVRDLREVYRVKELDENTEVYGVVGNPVSYSVSPYMQNAAFRFHNLNAVYIPFEVKNLDEFIEKFVREETREINLNFRGFSVTIPHKQAIIKHLDFIDEAAEKIGAVNTLKIADGKVYGYNTDAHGFIEPLKNAYGNLSGAKVAVIGAGGAARSCVYALKKENAEITIFVRNPEKAEPLAEEFDVNLQEIRNQKSEIRGFEILVNATPLGMKGDFENETPFSYKDLAGLNLVYDLVYNPFETRLLTEAEKANVPRIGGLAMLVAQGMRQFEIWTGKNAPLREMSRAALERLK